ncbi:aminoglycoside phosphotransferase family protein [Catenuloplanes atrovinosus]|uniref:Streptomycin 6-kinase n=1 Tax=Catenuloplanes atrovinosus TaxID=137266 RepID=A0AAE3YPK5_9ACTN|nr:aminoglycoside phosphotransferase family protein [Catenuloplanes atrovinosus]MDR7277504.1 streptomycin 6-kinase [Catenuloplanes atrovinosus]
MVTETFRRTVIGNWGDEGARWLDTLPTRVEAVAARWELGVGPPYPLRFNWVAPVRRAGGEAAVLKLGLPSAGHISAERAALTRFAGRGAVRLLAHDDADGALLLERVVPGTSLRTLVPHDDEAATARFVDVARRLHRPLAVPDAALEPVEAHADDLAAHLARHPDDRLVATALGVHRELCASATARVVLHGDLHHDNILTGTREPWLAIDPHGRTGDPASEAGAFLYNPDPWVRDDALTRLAPARVEQIADGLTLPYDRVLAWGFVLCVLSWVWHVEERPDYRGRELDVARLLRPKLP